MWVKGQKWLAQKREYRSAPPGWVRKNSQQLTSHMKNTTYLIKHELGQYPTYFKAICSFPTVLSIVLNNAFELQSSQQLIPTFSCHLNHAIPFTSFFIVSVIYSHHKKKIFFPHCSTLKRLSFADLCYTSPRKRQDASNLPPIITFLRNLQDFAYPEIARESKPCYILPPKARALLS